MPALFTPTAFGDLTASQVGQLLEIAALKPSDEPIASSASLHNDVALAIILPPTATLIVDLDLIWNSNSTADFQFAWSTPAGVTGWYTVKAAPLGAAATATYLGALTWGSAGQNEGFGSDVFSQFHGVITTGVAGGTLQFRWAQNTSNAGTTVVRANSLLRAKQVK